MANYIRSNENRFYAAVESSYSQAAAIGSANRFPAQRLQAQQVFEKIRRQDKTGTRTFLNNSGTGRVKTGWELRTFLSQWGGPTNAGYGPLFQAALGGDPDADSGLSVESVSGRAVTTVAAHGRSIGAGISNGFEIRFITQIIAPNAFVINAPFSQGISTGTKFSPTVSYRLGTKLKSVSIYDYWDPITIASRLLTGAAVDTLDISVNGDQHTFVFSGPACDLLDSITFAQGAGGLNSFPTEPTLTPSIAASVPGHLGQAWIGGTSAQFFTVTEASVHLRNNLELRNREFGSSYARAVVAGPREIATNFTLFAQDDNQTLALYAAAKNQQNVSAMLQMGQQSSQLMGIYLPSVVPELPVFDDSETRLQWRFKNNVAQGIAEDELYIALA